MVNLFEARRLWFGSAITTALDLESLLKKLTEKVREHFSVDVCDIRVKEGEMWRVIGISGIAQERISTTTTRCSLCLAA